MTGNAAEAGTHIDEVMYIDCAAVESDEHNWQLCFGCSGATNTM